MSSVSLITAALGNKRNRQRAVLSGGPDKTDMRESICRPHLRKAFTRKRRIPFTSCLFLAGGRTSDFFDRPLPPPPRNENHRVNGDINDRIERRSAGIVDTKWKLKYLEPGSFVSANRLNFAPSYSKLCTTMIFARGGKRKENVKEC